MLIRLAPAIIIINNFYQLTSTVKFKSASFNYTRRLNETNTWRLIIIKENINIHDNINLCNSKAEALLYGWSINIICDCSHKKLAGQNNTYVYIMDLCMTTCIHVVCLQEIKSHVTDWRKSLVYLLCICNTCMYVQQQYNHLLKVTGN